MVPVRRLRGKQVKALHCARNCKPGAGAQHTTGVIREGERQPGSASQETCHRVVRLSAGVSQWQRGGVISRLSL